MPDGWADLDAGVRLHPRYPFAELLANGTKAFGMWLPNTDPSGSGLIMPARYRGQEGAAADAAAQPPGCSWSHGLFDERSFGKPASTTWRAANGRLAAPNSAWVDATNPDLSAFEKCGGKMMRSGSNYITLASPRSQLDYYLAVLDKYGPF